MNVIGDRLDVVVDVGVEMRSGLAGEPAALNHVEQMGNNAGFDNALAILVKIDAPRIAGALGEDFEFMSHGMIPPNARVDASALAVWRAGPADIRMREHTMATVKPSVRTPGEGV